ncbi:MAG: single-stranded DNA-binding protein [Oscillospiraceae bacterium]|nr:single-stranded DNA-binding protein [Oscillospiraceae bacterium]
MNKAILIGNLASDPETRTTQSGIAQCTFRLAVQRRFANQQGVREADFLQIVCWRQTAELCARYLSKGRKVAVEGSIQTRSYDAQDGTKRYVTEIVAENVEFLSSREEGQRGGYDAPAAPAPRMQQAPMGNGGFTEVDDDELPF